MIAIFVQGFSSVGTHSHLFGSLVISTCVSQVINFFEGPLGLITPEDIRGREVGGVTRRDLMKIPILVVGSEAMNENVKHGAHGHCGTVLTRGLCLSERIKEGDCSGGGRRVGVTAILCVSGLPADLTASILAHGT